MIPFYCNSCGLCCKKIGGIPGFEEMDNGKGTCIYLNENHQCSIYETRPLQCRITEGFKAYFAESMTWDEYITANSEVCRVLKEEDQNERKRK